MATSHVREIVPYLRRAALRGEGVELTDGQLLESYVRRRDVAALEALVLRHGPMVWGVCRRVLGGHHDAEDAFQAAFLVLVRRAASVVPREMVANWLYGVARQTALKARATAAKRRARERPVTDMPEPAALGQDPHPDVQALLDQELSRLPDKYRVAVVLCDLEGKTRKEAARQLAWPEGTVASRLMRARALLARRLARQGLPVSGGTLAVALSQQASACVPASVVASTIKAVTLLSSGPAAAGVVPAKVVALMEGVVKTMLLTKLKTASAAVLLAGIMVVASVGSGGLINQLKAVQRVDASPQGDRPPAKVVRPEGEQPNEIKKVSEQLPEKRRQRLLRWKLSFDTKNAADYAKQLEALGATLAVSTDDPSRYRVIRDLSKRPVTAAVEDVRPMQHIFWVEGNDEAIRSLSRELGLTPPPQRMIVFLPRFIEDEMLRKELAHARRQEEDIAETTFRFFRTETGFDLKVACQEPKPGKAK